MKNSHSSLLAGNQTRYVIGLLGMYLLCAIAHNSQGVMLSSYISHYSLTSALQGMPGSMESIGLIASIVLCGILMRAMKKHSALLLASGLCAVSLIGLGLKLPFAGLCACYVLFGLSYGVMDALSSSLISDLFPNDSARIMGYVRAVFGLGGLGFPVLMTAMLHGGLAWNQVLLLLGIAGIVLLALYYFVGHRSLPESIRNTPRSEGAVTMKNVARFLKTPGGIGVCLFCITYGGHQIGLTVWVIRYITQYMSATALGEYALTLFWSGAFFSRLILPRLIRSHRIHMVCGNILSSLLLIGGLFSGNGTLLCILMPLIGFAEGSLIPMLVDYACSLDRSNSAVASAVVVLMDNIGGTLTPLAIGALISAIGPRTGIYILPILSLTAALVAAISTARRKTA